METSQQHIKPIVYQLTEQEEKQQIIKLYKQLVKKAEPKFKNASDSKNIKKAFWLAAEAHKETRRKTGEPYIFHPIAVAKIVLEEIGLGIRSLICALLHDTVEDTEITLLTIENEFGKEIAGIVEGLTKIATITDASQSKQAENIKKILVSLVHDPRVILIKLADRLHNMRTLDAMRAEKKIKIASETLSVYVPIAHRLGLYNIKTELEDWCMKYLESSLFNEIQFKLKETIIEREQYIKEVIEPLKKNLKKKCDFKIDIIGRTKSISSIARKMKNQNINFEEVYDIFAIRIVVDVEKENEKTACWEIYSIISSLYRTLPDRLRDWLSNPKMNGYEALHTTVLGHNANWVEIQIRTKRMNEIAERGVAAHFLYKEKTKNPDVFDLWYMQIRDLIATENLDSIEFVSEFQAQIYDETIYAFTPKGDVKTLPKEATLLDFAYAIHGNIGDKCIGGKVNYKLEPLSYKLKTGDKIEILTAEKQTPQIEWLDFVVSVKAIHQIKNHFKTKNKLLQQNGIQILNLHLVEKKLIIPENKWNGLLKHFNAYSKDFFYQQIGKKTIDISVFSEDFICQLEEIQLSANELAVNYQAEFQYKVSTCCNPIQGDNIVGILISKINPVKINIHRTDCAEGNNLLSKYDCKIVQIKWQEHSAIQFLTTLSLEGIDAVGIIYNITKIITQQNNINISAFNIEAENGKFYGTLKLFVASKDELEKLIKELKLNEGIVKVVRAI